MGNEVVDTKISQMFWLIDVKHIGVPPCWLQLDFSQFRNHSYRPQRSWGKVIFSVACVKNSVHGGSTWAGMPPGRYIPWWVHTPWQVHPSGRYTSWKVHPQGGTPWQVHPPAGTPPGRYTPPQQVHTWAGTHPWEQCMLGDTSNKRAVRIQTGMNSCLGKCFQNLKLFACHAKTVLYSATNPSI